MPRPVAGPGQHRPGSGRRDHEARNPLQAHGGPFRRDSPALLRRSAGPHRRGRQGPRRRGHGGRTDADGALRGGGAGPAHRQGDRRVAADRARVRGPGRRAQPRVRGDTETGRTFGLDPERLPRETYVLRSVGNDLFIGGRESGGDPFAEHNPDVGPLFGVYEILEEVLGVRWLWPGELGTYVPRTDVVRISAIDQTAAPALRFRHFSWGAVRSVALGGAPLDPGDEKLGFSRDVAVEYGKAVQVLLRRHRFGGMDAKPPSGHAFSGWWQRTGASTRTGSSCGGTACAAIPTPVTPTWPCASPTRSCRSSWSASGTARAGSSSARWTARGAAPATSARPGTRPSRRSRRGSPNGSTPPTTGPRRSSRG